MERATGALPSPKDERDFTIAASRAAGRTEIPRKHICPLQPVKDQGGVGACVAFSMASMLESLMYKDRGYSIPVSPGYIYLNMGEDDFKGYGRYPREVLKRLQKVGYVPHREYRHLSEENKPHPPIDKCNPRFKVGNYYSLDSKEEVKQFLANEDAYVSVTMHCNTGLACSRYNGEYVLEALPNVQNGNSSHQVCIVGYDDDFTLGSSKGAFLVQNSWGDGWGDAGYAWLLYEHYHIFVIEAWGVEADYRQVMHHNIGTDTFTINGIEGKMDTSSRLIDDCTMMHIRAVTETRGDVVTWLPSAPNEWSIEFRANEDLGG